MIHAYSLGRAVRYYPEKAAFPSSEQPVTFRELHDRVGSIAAALKKHGLKAGDRLAILLPNELEFIELIYACAWLGLIVVPLNTRLSEKEIDHVLADATPRGLIRHSSLAAPTVQLPLQRVIDKETFDFKDDALLDPVYDAAAVFAL